MSIKRLLPEGVEIVCLCGAPTVYAAADLTVGIGVVATPVCPSCQTRRADIFVQGGEPTGYPEGTMGRMRAAKAVLQWLVGAGRFAEGVTAEKIPAALGEGATAWPTGAPVEVPLAETFAKAHAAWLRTHPQ
jgi:hypothetical protein